MRRRGGSEELDGEGVMVEDRWRGEAGELRESEVELGVGFARAERLWRSGVMAFRRFGAGHWRGNEGIGIRGFP